MSVLIKGMKMPKECADCYIVEVFKREVTEDD